MLGLLCPVQFLCSRLASLCCHLLTGLFASAALVPGLCRVKPGQVHLHACRCATAKMTRGNQRDTDRARALKRSEKAGKATAKDKDGLSKETRMARDAAALQAKLAAKQAAEGGK